jgi:hypothetical protein
MRAITSERRLLATSTFGVGVRRWQAMDHDEVVWHPDWIGVGKARRIATGISELSSELGRTRRLSNVRRLSVEFWANASPHQVSCSHR